jgi:hypothetical protein
VQTSDYQKKSTGIYDITYEECVHIDDFIGESNILGDGYKIKAKVGILESAGDSLDYSIEIIYSLIKDFSYSQNLDKYKEIYNNLQHPNIFLNFIPYNLSIQLLQEARQILNDMYYEVKSR